MQVLERHIQQVQEDADAALNVSSTPEQSSLVKTTQVLVLLAGNLWPTIIDALATEPPTDRESKREVARLLRAAEHAFSSVQSLVKKSEDLAVEFKGMGRLADAIRECRGMILMPTAKRMAERDPERRTAHRIRDLLVHRVEFRDGHAIISPEVALDFPCPLDPEPAA